MAVLITGGTGFVGLAAAEALGRQGFKCILFADRPAPASYIATPELSMVSYAEGDIRSESDLANALKLAEVTHVVHLAAVTPSEVRERQNPRSISDVNVGGTAALMSALRGYKSTVRVVVVSSVAVYGLPTTDNDLDETNSIPSPVSLYGISKLAAEQTATRLGALFELDVRIIRLGPVFGPWEYRTDSRDLTSPHCQILENLRSGEEIILPRPLRADWLYSRDAGKGIATVLMATNLRSIVFNLGGPEQTDLIGWCGRLAQDIPDIRWRLPQADERPTVHSTLERDRPSLACARIKSEAGFRHAYDQELAARDYVAWLKDIDPEMQRKS